ncbi:MAG: IS21 family transposase [Solirubrobacterales bacterium]|nr:IS21 family transposase [Solirubrobacterales bacterium]
MLDVQRWAEIRRMRLVENLSIHEIVRRTGHDRNTVRRAIRRDGPPVYRRPKRSSKLDPHRPRIHELLREDPAIPSLVIRERITEEEGYAGGKTILDDYVRDLRPVFRPPRTHQRTVYRRGEICQFDLWEPSAPIPVGHGQLRRGWVVVAVMGWSRAGAGALVFSKRLEDIAGGISHCLRSLGGLPKTLVFDREGALHAGEGRPTEAFAAYLGQLGVGWHFCDPRDPQAKGVVERLQLYLETSFEPGRGYANHLDFQGQLERWFSERANARTHRSTRAVPAERLAAEREAMRPLPERMPQTARRWVTRVPAQPFVRLDTNDYSLDPRFAGRRVEVRAGQRELLAVALDTGELVCRHRRRFARHLTIAAPEHEGALRELRVGRRGEVEVELRPLERYDALIAP